MPAKKSTAKTASRNKAVGKSTAVKKAAGSKKTASKAVSKKAPAKKAVAKKAPAKPTAAKKPAAPARKKSAPAKSKPVAAVKKAAASSTAQKPASPLSGFKKFTPYQESKGESYMSDRMSAHFREILWAWKRELMEEVDRTVHHMQDEAANFPDPNDRASQEADFTMELRTRDRERKLIKKIDEALRALEEHDYGYCEVCGVEIGIRRLEARPTATLCIDCKTLDEIRERQMG